MNDIIMIPFMIVWFAICSAVPITAYVLSSLGLYRMAKACNLNTPGLAWVPIANLYVLGSIAEIGASRGGKKSMPFRKILPGLTIGMIVVVFVMIIALVAVVILNMDALDTEAIDDPIENVEVVSDGVSYVDYEIGGDFNADFEDDDIYIEEEYNPEADALAASVILVVLAFYLVMIVAAILVSVFEYVARWHVYKLFDESNAVLYLLLTIFVSIATPIIDFILGRKTPALPTVNVSEPTAYPVYNVASYTAATEAPTEQAPTSTDSDNQF
jgi:hypothetical protein